MVLIRTLLSRGSSGKDYIAFADAVCELVPSFSEAWKLGKCLCFWLIIFRNQAETRGSIITGGERVSHRAPAVERLWEGTNTTERTQPFRAQALTWAWAEIRQGIKTSSVSGTIQDGPPLNSAPPTQFKLLFYLNLFKTQGYFVIKLFSIYITHGWLFYLPHTL